MGGARKRPRQAAAASRAVGRFLEAVGVPRAVRARADVAGTPGRVAQAFLEDLLDGYRNDPAQVLAESMPAASGDLVAVTGIDFHAVCPHHLLPYRGVAHVAYLPGRRVVGFGQVARLVDALAHRLVIEEDLARDVAQALVRHLGARGAACALDAEQLCLTVRGERRRGARAHVQCFAGSMRRDAGLQRRFLDLVNGAGAVSETSDALTLRGARRTRAPSPRGERDGEVAVSERSDALTLRGARR
ncbi:MAG TPA: GTP cyclohydrolase I FolE, partial [Anaeromyxobacteraceae bacterium]|nr:GTP cyclohydrolase I FolE [Anaeromyxobacteraceae bacterium]